MGEGLDLLSSQNIDLLRVDSSKVVSKGTLAFYLSMTTIMFVADTSRQDSSSFGLFYFFGTFCYLL